MGLCCKTAKKPQITAVAMAGSHQSCVRWGSEGEEGHWRTAVAPAVGCHLPALLWGSSAPSHTPGPSMCRAGEQCTVEQGVPCALPAPDLIVPPVPGAAGSSWHHCGSLRPLSCIQLHPLWDPLLAPSLQQGGHMWPSKPKGKARAQNLGFPPYLLRSLLHLLLLPEMSCSHRSSIQLQRQSKQLSV